jgi:hypothetical protein
VSDVVLTLWTSDPERAVQGDEAGIDRIGVDLERIGKRERQAGLGTWVSPHTLDDLSAVGRRLHTAELFVRIDPLGRHTARQIDHVLARGATVLMLPMFSSAEDVEQFIQLLAGRADPVLLVERRAAVERIEEIVSVQGVREIHVGVNDLSLELGLRNRFRVLVSEEVERVADATLAAGLRFGVGGLGAPRDTSLPIPSDLIYAQHARLGSTAALIARRFARDGETLTELIHALRRRLAEWAGSPSAEIAAAHRELVRATASAAVW